MADATNILNRIKEEEVEFVDLRFTDPRGKWQHVAMAAKAFDEDCINDGIMFDGSSISGWKDINESDMMLVPDLDTAVVDPFFAQNTMIIICDVHEPSTGEPYERCPRSVAKKAEAFMRYSGAGDNVFFGPEPEFFVFDDVRFDVSMNHTFYSLDEREGPYNAGKEFEGGNLGHRPPPKGGYFPVPPVDSAADLRSEMLTVMEEMGVVVEKHHHEVAPSQHELGMRFAPLVQSGDHLQIYKYVVHQVANSYGKTATFMPKPVAGDNGSGMHVHQSLWKDDKPLFAGGGYADLSETALYYIGGIMKHAHAINAFSNPGTNSYKRLIPGFEAPVLLAYSSRNRSAACRIPYAASPKGKRVEIRFPDPTTNGYLAFAAMLMAGLDGVENKIHPGDPMDKDLYALPPEEVREVPKVASSLREALEALDSDREFLKKGDVMTDDVIDGYLELKWGEVTAFEQAPHPVEFMMYYSS